VIIVANDNISSSIVQTRYQMSYTTNIVQIIDQIKRVIQKTKGIIALGNCFRFTW
jgi:hypothetical protein